MNRNDIVTGDHKPLKRVQSRHLRQNQTPSEMAVWRHLKGNRLGGLHFRRQQIIDGYIVDFCCHAAGMVVELDGDVHGSQREEDAIRQATLERRGLLVVRVTNAEIAQDLQGVLDHLLGVADRRVEERGNGVLPLTPP